MMEDESENLRAAINSIGAAALAILVVQFV